MKRLIAFLFTGCFHSWKTISNQLLTDSTGDVIGSRYVFRCEKCGEVKKKDLT